MKIAIVWALIGAIVAEDFGQKYANGTWIECSDENTNCADSDHTNQAGAVCARRVLKFVDNDALPEYVAEV